MRYIKSAVDVGFVSEKDVGGKLECTSYVNSDLTGDLDKQRSTARYVLYFTVYSGSIDDRSKVYDSDRGCKRSNLTSGLMVDLGIE